jgi:hypothetical protein
MQHGMGVKSVLLDLSKHGEDFIQYLKARNPETEDQIRKRVEQNSLLLVNKFDDIWWFEIDLINYFFGEMLEQVFNFYQGPLLLT